MLALAAIMMHASHLSPLRAGVVSMQHVCSLGAGLAGMAHSLKKTKKISGLNDGEKLFLPEFHLYYVMSRGRPAVLEYHSTEHSGVSPHTNKHIYLRFDHRIKPLWFPALECPVPTITPASLCPVTVVLRPIRFPALPSRSSSSRPDRFSREHEKLVRELDKHRLPRAR